MSVLLRAAPLLTRGREREWDQEGTRTKNAGYARAGSSASRLCTHPAPALVALNRNPAINKRMSARATLRLGGVTGAASAAAGASTRCPSRARHLPSRYPSTTSAAALAPPAALLFSAHTPTFSANPRSVSNRATFAAMSRASRRPGCAEESSMPTARTATP